MVRLLLKIGIIERFSGSMTSAIFGAPVKSNNHAEQAVQASLDSKYFSI